MTSNLILLGGGEHACVLVESARSAGWNVAGAFGRIAHKSLPCEHLGNSWDPAVCLRRVQDPHTRWIIAVGTRQREKLISAWANEAVHWASVIDPHAFVSTTATIDAGTYVAPNAFVGVGARVGKHVILNSGSICEHHVTVREGAHIAPGATVGGGAEIGPCVQIGLGATVRDHVTIGSHSTVGMGSVVVSNVAKRVVVIGVPARRVG